MQMYLPIDRDVWTATFLHIQQNLIQGVSMKRVSPSAKLLRLWLNAVPAKSAAPSAPAAPQSQGQDIA
jgi:hypothetical protein